MSNSTNWPIAVTGYDNLRTVTKRIDRMARNASPIAAADLLGPIMSSQAVHIIDWNDEVATFNGFVYTLAGGLNAPVVQDEEGEDLDLPWTGTIIAREDGTGIQQAWNTDDPSSMFFRTRNWAPNPVDPDGPPIFGLWQRFATRSGFIADEDLHPDVRDEIDQALENAEAGLGLVLSVNKAYRQTSPPSDPDPDGRALVVNDTWYDSDNTDRPYRWSGSAWVDATTAWLTTNPSSTFPNVVISPAGLVAYNGAGVAVTSINSSNGFLTTTGSIFSSADISGSTVTGGTLQTTATAARGIKMNSSGLVAYDGGGSPTLVIVGSTGSVTLAGALLSGATLTGSSLSTSGTAHVEIGATGFGQGIRFYDASGHASTVQATVGTLVLSAYGGGVVTVDSNGMQVDRITIDEIYPHFGSTVDVFAGIDMNGHTIGAVSQINNGGSVISMAASLDISGDVTAHQFWMDTSVATPGGNALFEGASGLIRPNVAPSLVKWKRDITPLPVDLASLAELGRGTISFRYRDDIDLPFPVDNFDQVFYGVSLDLALELGGLDLLVGNDAAGNPFEFLRDQLPITLLAGYGHHDERLSSIEQRLQAAGI